MFRTAVSVAMLFVLVCASAVPAFAWDDTGHKISTYIAWQRMAPEVRARVVKILLAAPEDSQLATLYANYGSRTEDSRKREFFMVASSWADIIRDRNYKTRFEKYAHSDWHYSDTFWEWKDGKVLTLKVEEPGGKALEKMVDFNQVIRGSASDAEKAIAIAWLEHLIGDIHQPLHTSARVTEGFPKGDQGGNLFLLTPRGTPRDKQENLHWFWDSIIVRYQPNSKDACEADYLDPIAQDIMRQHPYDKMKDRINNAKFDAWVAESFKVATSEVFRGVEWFQMPSDSYKKKAYDIARERLALAGYRMGDLFNDAFTVAVTTAPAPAVK